MSNHNLDEALIADSFRLRLRMARKMRRVSQQKIADFLGVSLRTYQRYESGENEPSIGGLYKIALFLGVTADYLLCLDSEEPFEE